jgi:hypothetical protein
MNQEIVGEYTLNKDTPIIIEKDMFFGNENINTRDFFLLNEVILEAEA